MGINLSISFYGFFFFLIYWNTVDLQCCVKFQVYSNVNHIHSLSFPHIDYYSRLLLLYSRSLVVIYSIYSKQYAYVNLNLPIYHFPPCFPFGNHKFDFEICVSVLSIIFIRFHIQMISHAICLWYISLSMIISVSSMLLQMALFYYYFYG